VLVRSGQVGSCMPGAHTAASGQRRPPDPRRRHRPLWCNSAAPSRERGRGAGLLLSCDRQRASGRSLSPNRRRPLRSEQRDVRRGPLTGGAADLPRYDHA